MAGLGEQNTSRRVSRSASRQVSEEAASIAGDTRATPQRFSRRVRDRSTPAKDTQVGNRGSAAYGAKGKEKSATPMSKEDAERDPEYMMSQAVREAEEAAFQTSGRARSLAPVVEEANVDEPSLQNPNDNLLNRDHRPADLRINTDVPKLNRGAPPSVMDNHAAGAVDEVDEPEIHASFLQRLGQRISAWFVGTEYDEYPQLQLRRAPFMNDWGEVEFRYEARDTPEPARHFFAVGRKFLTGLTYILLLIFIVFCFLVYCFPAVRTPLGFELGLPRTDLDLRLAALETLYKSSGLMNGQGTHALYDIDWFAKHNDAVIDPNLTSPSHPRTCDKVAWEDLWWFEKYISGGVTRCPVDAPAQALKSWSDLGDAYCAPPRRGKVQLVVITPRKISPTKLIIEHFPQRALITKGNAPKEIELLVDVPDAGVRESILNAIERYDSGLLYESSPQDSRKLASAQTLPYTYVPIGRWKYNIWDKSNIQAFDIPLDLNEYGLKGQKFALRVNSNWGNYGMTCLYRVRLFGRDVSGFPIESLPME